MSEPEARSFHGDRGQDRLWAFGLALGSLAGYASTASRFALGGDNAEFLTLASSAGVAHPSGYPLYVFTLRLLTALSPFSPALTGALATALIAASANVCLYFAARRWGAGSFSAGAAAVLFATSPRAWLAGTHAEVFALNALFAAAILLASAPTAGPKSAAQAARLGLLAGLGLANHLSIVLLSPLGLAKACDFLGDWRTSARNLCAGAGGLLLGLTPYLGLLAPVPADTPWSWGRPSSLGDLVHHVSRADYGVLNLGLTSGGASAVDEVRWLLAGITSDLCWLPPLLVPFGLVAFARNVQGLRARSAKLAPFSVALTLLVCGPLFISRFDLAASGTSKLIVERFYLLPELVCSWLIAGGSSWLIRRYPPPLRVTLRRAVGALLVTGVCALQGLRFGEEVAEHHGPAVQRYLENTLASCPERAVVLGTGDHRLFGFAFVQGILEQRRDVLYVDPNMLHYGWYRQRIESELGAELPPLEGTSAGKRRSVNTVALAERVLRTGRPLLLANAFTPRILRSYPNYPTGTLIRILPLGSIPPPIAELQRQNRALLEAFRLDYPVPTDPSSWATLVHRSYAQTWEALRHAAEANATAPGNAGQP